MGAEDQRRRWWNSGVVDNLDEQQYFAGEADYSNRAREKRRASASSKYPKWPCLLCRSGGDMTKQLKARLEVQEPDTKHER